jgi:putative oxidoreductase
LGIPPALFYAPHSGVFTESIHALLLSQTGVEMKWLERFSEGTYAWLRILSGFQFTFHGAQKVLGLFATSKPPIGSQIWLGGLIELLGGLAVLLGFQTRIAAFLCSGTMAVAYFQFHWRFRFGQAFFPTINEGELAVVYCFVFLYIACKGGGRWSLDKHP